MCVSCFEVPWVDLKAVDRASIDLPEAEDIVAGSVLERRLCVCLLLILLFVGGA